ncbi:MAG: hypothetical protein IJT29_01595 [Oscillospiraceae bacterium]|nr:hypothetical protein [Oscillospiraceae bacterium]
MLGRLMKHEFRATGRIMLPLLAAELILAVLAGFSVRGLERMEDMNFLRAVYVMTLILFGLGMFAIFVMAFVLMIQRFYRSLLRDEGYVSMTLPVTVDAQIWAKLLCSFVWFVAAAALFFLSMFVVLSIGSFVSFPNQAELREFWRAVRAAVEELGVGSIVLYLLELFAVVFFGICAICLRCYAAMAIGCSAADRKLLLSFVAYIAIGIALGMVSNAAAFTVLPRVDTSYFYDRISADWFMHVVMLGDLVIEAGLSALFYFVTRYFLKNKLNLA